MSDGVGCANCDSTGWVCENHPDKPWDGNSERFDACKCGGAGMPCAICNPCDATHPPRMGPGFVVKLTPDGHLH